MDAVPFLIEKKGAGVAHQMDFNLLKEMRDFLTVALGRCRSCWPRRTCRPTRASSTSATEGDRLQMMLNFPVNQRLFYALATGDIDPLIKALEETRKRPRNAQWVQFLRSHDELDLGRLTDEQRQKVFDGVRPGEADAALRSRHPASSRADARQRSQEAGARLQPAVLAARHADDAVRRRDRHRRRPAAAGARVRAHADAVDGGAARRLLARAEGRAAGHQRRDLRLPARQRGGAAPRSATRS